MSLVLDPRQRAMLSEMGIEVWLAEPTVNAVTAVPGGDAAPNRALPTPAASLPRHGQPPSAPGPSMP